MAFTFDETLATDLAKVRFHVGDTHSDGHYLEDGTITALLTSEGSVGGAVVACLKYIITQLSSPNFRLDWLTVSNEQARDGYEKLLKSKALEFGISLSKVTASSTISLPYRSDSYQYSNVTRTVTEDDNDTMHDGTP